MSEDREYSIQLSADVKRTLELLWEAREMIQYRVMIWNIVSQVYPLQEGKDVITSSSMSDDGVLKVMVGKPQERVEAKDQIETELKNQ